MSTHHDDEPPAKRAREEEQTKHAEDDAVPAAADQTAARDLRRQGRLPHPRGAAEQNDWSMFTLIDTFANTATVAIASK